MEMPAPDQTVIARRDEIAAALRRIVPGEGVILSEPERRAYESDGLTAYHQPPLIVVLPSTVAEVAAVLRYCHSEGIKVVPRGAGTSLSGGALPLADGVLLGMAKFNRVLDIDYDNRAAVVQPGVTNLGITKAVEQAGFYYAPDPSSAIHAAEDFVHAGYPLDVEALLIIELDGPEPECNHLLDRVSAIAKACGATTLRASNSEAERLKFWAGRKAAFPAVGRISPDYYCMDGTIPRARLAEVLAKTSELSQQYGLRVANVFHAGDGNLHPLILYDANQPGEIEKAEAFGADILRACVELGGVLTGEHGVGVEKRDLMGDMFTEIDLNHQQRLKCAFDEEGLLNPGKVFPTLCRCAELGRVHVRGGQTRFPELPRF